MNKTWKLIDELWAAVPMAWAGCSFASLGIFFCLFQLFLRASYWEPLSDEARLGYYIAIPIFAVVGYLSYKPWGDASKALRKHCEALKRT